MVQSLSRIEISLYFDRIIIVYFSSSSSNMTGNMTSYNSTNYDVKGNALPLTIYDVATNNVTMNLSDIVNETAKKYSPAHEYFE